jgi:HNH endonuclease
MIVPRRRSPNGISAMARFMSRVLFMPSGCWLWVGSRSGKYGLFWHNGRLIGAHRFIKVVETGQAIPKKLEPDHLCRNTWCVNPQHSEIVTRKINLSRSPTASTLNAAKTHCPRGHPLSGNNVRTKRGRYGDQRVCVICDREHCRLFRQARKENAIGSAV